MFRNFMKDKGLEEIPDAIEIEEKITRVQNVRSKSALDKDNSITAMKIENKENAGDLIQLVKNPGRSDLEGVDTIEAK